jgi:peroxiredoxin
MIEVVRLLLAAVFAVAGVAKLADLRVAAQAAQSFGAPRRAALPVALLVALAELAIAAGLVPAVSARPAAAAAAALVAVFTAAIAISLLRGRTPDCHCFGRLHSAPAGPATLARNAGLAAVAVLVALRPAADPTWLALAAATVAIVVVAQAIAWVVLLRRYGRALRRIDELETDTELVAEESHPLEVGADAPRFELPGLDGADVGLSDLLDGTRPVVLVVTDERCGACTALYPDVARWQRKLLDHDAVVVLGTGSPEKLRVLAEEHELDVVLLADRTTLAGYGVYGTPSAVVVDSEGRIASPVVYGTSEIRAILGEADEPLAAEAVAYA